MGQDISWSHRQQMNCVLAIKDEILNKANMSLEIHHKHQKHAGFFSKAFHPTHHVFWNDSLNIYISCVSIVTGYLFNCLILTKNHLFTRWESSTDKSQGALRSRFTARMMPVTVWVAAWGALVSFLGGSTRGVLGGYEFEVSCCKQILSACQGIASFMWQYWKGIFE